MNEYINEITLIVKYFYFYVLCKSKEKNILFLSFFFFFFEALNCRKQENDFEGILNDLINGQLTFIDENFYSSILTTIIEDFILTSTLANDYLLAQPMIINQMEYSLPFVTNIEYENHLLYNNEISLNGNPFSDLKDLEDYLNSCERKYFFDKLSD
jgi:hypothetical protein